MSESAKETDRIGEDHQREADDVAGSTASEQLKQSELDGAGDFVDAIENDSDKFNSDDELVDDDEDWDDVEAEEDEAFDTINDLEDDEEDWDDGEVLEVDISDGYREPEEAGPVPPEALAPPRLTPEEMQPPQPPTLDENIE